MPMDEFEERMTKRNLTAFVDSDDIEVVLHRSEVVKTPAGGTKRLPDVALPPQRGRLVPFKRRMTQFVIDTQYGDIPMLPYVLVMRDPETADIRRGDWFQWQGQDFEVEAVDFKRGVRVAAEITYRGKPSG